LRRPGVWRVAAALVVGLCGAFLTRQIFEHLDAVRGFPWRIDGASLALSLGVQAATLLAGVGLWARLARHLGAPTVGARALLPVWAGSSLARYLPGGIWQLVVAAALAHRRQIGAAVMLRSLAVHSGIVAVAAALFASAALLPALWLPAAVVVAVGGVHPRLVGVGLRIVDRLARHDAPVPTPLSWSLVLSQLAASVGLWVSGAVAFWLLLHACTSAPVTNLPRLGGANAAAFVAGLLVVPAPAGLGVREVVLEALGRDAWPGGVAAALAAVSRLWTIACDLLVLGVAALVAALPPRRAAVPPAPPSDQSQTASTP
jgi:hypothetical protein